MTTKLPEIADLEESEGLGHQQVPRNTTQLLDMILPYRQFDCANAIPEKRISHHSSLFFCSSFRASPFNHSTDCKDARCQACEQGVNLCYFLCQW